RSLPSAYISSSTSISSAHTLRVPPASTCPSALSCPCPCPCPCPLSAAATANPPPPSPPLRPRPPPVPPPRPARAMIPEQPPPVLAHHPLAHLVGKPRQRDLVQPEPLQA